MSGGFYLLFAFLFSVGPLEASREILLCKSPSLEVWYTLCDERNALTLSLHPCTYKVGEFHRLSLTWITRMDLLRVSVQVDVWKQSVKVSEYKYVLCSGADDYYPFCGAIKGETIEFSSDTLLPRLHLVQDKYIFSFKVLAGEQEKMAFCGNVSLIQKE
ncbi:lymphocyte antigen 96-like isoform X1 [Xenopus laevis]|uniref:Lymphocyte antigen 96-like isoform X1 n=1 Tax=Xenopus laevis TaxID=8355 RepID=A0A8J1KYP0_XENLA|nr:lymphocyte antigen 96-like isoform X1 [Xenopus laevis]